MESRNENRRLIVQYPFLRPWGAYPTSIESTELDTMPTDWRITFGEELCKEIMEELTQNNCVDSYRIVQIKENTVRFAGTHRAAQNGFTGDRSEVRGSIQTNLHPVWSTCNPYFERLGFTLVRCLCRKVGPPEVC